MRVTSMFLGRVSPSFAALKMEAAVISPSTSSVTSLLRGFSPVLVFLRGSHIACLNSGQHFRWRDPRRVCAYSSESPFPLLLPKVVPKEQDSEGKIPVGSDDCSAERITTVPKPEDLESETELNDHGKSATDSVIEELQRGCSVEGNDVPFKNVDASSLGRQRKRKVFAAQAPKRLYTEEEDLGFMQEALVEAKIAAKKGEVPVGAVLVHKNNIIARFHNQVETTNDPTAHAEMLCIRNAAAQLGARRLTDVTLYVTLEPCPMCAGAILQGRVSELVWGAPNSLLGADGSWIKLFPMSSSSEHEPKGRDYLHPFHRTIAVRRGVLAEESDDLMQTFIAMRRMEPKCRTDDAHMGVKSSPWPRSPGWLPPAFKKLNSWVQRWFQF
ncbi:hypothetical protein M758_10G033900 [Ceratodon purpureus]|nr:hypothetical protein M758_10G033900 [Ceratodon purpureus]